MRRSLLLFAALLALLPATSRSANAQHSPFGLFGALTRPFGALFGHHGRVRRHARTPRAQPADAPTIGPQSVAASIPREPTKLGRVGPAAWPSAYEDVLGYVFWPKDYGTQVRLHGYADIMTTLLAPASAGAAARRAASAVGTMGSGTQIKAGDASSATPPTMPCSGDAQPATEWLTRRLAEQLTLDDRQSGALARLRAAAIEAIETIRANCRDTASLPAPERLRAMEAMLWAVHDAVVYVREPLKSFYDSLTETQKAQLMAETPAASAPKASAGDDEDAARARFALAARLCGMPSANQTFGGRIERIIRPSRAQRASFEAFRDNAEQMAQMLLASCPLETPATPLDRLDTANTWIANIIFAVSSVGLSLDALYAGLTDEQRSRVDHLGS